MDKPEFSLVNKILWGFEIETDHSILAEKPDLMLINKKKMSRHLIVITVPKGPLRKSERK